jgi:hypothetical protein
MYVESRDKQSLTLHGPFLNPPSPSPQVPYYLAICPPRVGASFCTERSLFRAFDSRAARSSIWLHAVAPPRPTFQAHISSFLTFFFFIFVII